MSNFEYIISSLPYLTMDFKYPGQAGFNSVISDIKRDLDDRDCERVEFLLRGFSDKGLDADFYAEALRQRNRFLREYFRFDLNLRNAKVRYLNHQLGRAPETDVVSLGEDQEDLEEFEEGTTIDIVLSGTDLIGREKGLDDIVWKKADDLSIFHYFDLTAVLAYVTKLHIVDRWLALDEEQGRELFRKLVMEVKGTFKGVDSLSF